MYVCMSLETVSLLHCSYDEYAEVLSLVEIYCLVSLVWQTCQGMGGSGNLRVINWNAVILQITYHVISCDIMGNKTL